MVVDSVSDSSRSVIIEIREGDFVLSSNGVPDNNFADVVELVPVFVEIA